MFNWKNVAGAVCITALSGGVVHAIEVTANYDYTSTGAMSMANALLTGPGLSLTDASIFGQTKDLGGGDIASSSGTFTNDSGVYGLAAGIILSTGDVRDYGDGSNDDLDTTTNFDADASAEQELLLDQIFSANNYKDATQLDLTFNVASGVERIYFTVAFGTEEWDESRSSSFFDPFAIMLNGTDNIALYNDATVNALHGDMEDSGNRTELDGMLAPNGDYNYPVMRFEAAVTAGENTLSFIIADADDGQFDSVVYISGLTTVCDPTAGVAGGGIDGITDCSTSHSAPPTGVSEPASLALLGLGLLGLRARKRRSIKS